METKKLFSKTRILCASLLLWAAGAQAQNVVTGTVTSANDNLPMIGVTVLVEGDATRGVATDTNGNYSIKASENEVLSFSFIGYETVQAAVNNRTVIDVTMKASTNALDEVIVLGYTTQTKAEMSSAAVTLDGGDLTKITTSDVGTMLQGKVAGVTIFNTSGQPGDDATIRIRGTGSITAASDPLYVVDGLIGGSFNPNDVETLTVLKDAGATAIYGAEGAGGVIVITTKSARKGQKTEVNFKASVGIKEVLTGRMKMMNTAELYEAQKQFLPEVLFNAQRPASLLETDFDWVDAIFRTGVVQNYYASVAGSAGEKSSYYLSFDHYNEDGTRINTNYVRNSLRFNFSTEILPSLKMNTRLTYVNSRDKSASTYKTNEYAYKMMPWDTPYNEDGSLKDVHETGNWISQNHENILWYEKYNYAKSHGNDLGFDFQLAWQITPWLSLTSSNRFSNYNSKYITYTDPITAAEGTANPGEVYNAVSEGWGLSTSNILKAYKDFGKHSISGIIGYEYGINKSESTNATGVNLPIGATSLDSAAVSGSVGGYEEWGEGYSLLAQAQYGYDHKYILTASFRADASSKFAPNRRVGYFPSVSASWVISKENWLADSKTLNLLKLRASWGQTGNSAIGSFMYLNSYALDKKYNGQPAAYVTRQANPNLGWEAADMTNIGVDVSLWNRLDLTFDIYSITNKDLLLSVPQAPSTGFFEMLQNAGKVRNRGFEFAFNSKNILTKNFKWYTSFNIGVNRNKVVSTPTPEGFTQGNQLVIPGRDIYSWYLPKWLGVDPSNGDPVWEKLVKDENGNVIDRVPTNNVAEAEKQIVGSATPDFTGGFSNTFQLYGFQLDVYCNFVYGNLIYQTDRKTLDSDGAYTTYNMMSHDNGLKWKRWEKEGDVATHPKAVAYGNKNSNADSSRFLEDGSFLRIKNVTLSYNFPQHLLKKARISGLRLYAAVDNLATFTKFSGMDPEIDFEDGEYGEAYPVGRSYMFGVELKF